MNGERTYYSVHCDTRFAHFKFDMSHRGHVSRDVPCKHFTDTLVTDCDAGYDAFRQTISIDEYREPTRLGLCEAYWACRSRLAFTSHNISSIGMSLGGPTIRNWAANLIPMRRPSFNDVSQISRSIAAAETVIDGSNSSTASNNSALDLKTQSVSELRIWRAIQLPRSSTGMYIEGWAYRSQNLVCTPFGKSSCTFSNPNV